MRDARYDPLFEPIQFGPKTMKNRLWVTSHASGYGSDRPGTYGAYRAMRAEGGWGTVCTGFCSIHPESDEAPHVSSRIWDDGDVRNFRYMVEEVHNHGALAGIQLWYSGVHSPRYESRETARGPYSTPSSIVGDLSSYAAAADRDDIRALVNMYVLAARRAEQAGFDIAEILVGDYTLPMQFLERRSNPRTDEYGGSLANRARFLIELMSAVKRAVGERLAVTVRFEVETLDGPHGIVRHEEGLAFLELMTREGVVDLWSLKIGNFAEFGEDVGSSRFHPPNWNAPFMAGATDVVDVPVVSNGRFTGPDDMVEALKSGQCHIVGAARPAIADPFLPEKIDSGRLDEIRECIGCNACLARFEQVGPMYCTQNPTVGEEYRRGWHPEKFDAVAEPKTVLVIGAGPAGMECALTLARRGHFVHLRDRSASLGGHWARVSRLPRCAEYGRLTSYREAMLSKLPNVEVHLGVSEMSWEDVLDYGAEYVVVATGSRWSPFGSNGESTVPVDGIDAALPNVFTPEQVLDDVKPVIGRNIVVLDGEGHFMTFGLAEYMADRGLEVTIVTDKAEAAGYANFTGEMPNVKRVMHEKGIRTIVDHWVSSYRGAELELHYVYRDGSTLEELAPGVWGRRPGQDSMRIPCDSLIVATSRQPNDALFHDLKAASSRWEEAGIRGVYRVGDAVHPRQAMDAVFDGHRLAREFDSVDPQRPLPFIRERQLWGNPTVPILGDARPPVEGPLLA